MVALAREAADELALTRGAAVTAAGELASPLGSGGGVGREHELTKTPKLTTHV